MAASVTLQGPQGKNPTMYPCTVSVDGGADQPVSVVVSDSTLASVPEAEQAAYLQARAMLAVGDTVDAIATVTPFVSGDNWAQQWMGGNIPS